MSTYVLVGAGGTGSWLVPPLLAYLAGHEEKLDPNWQLLLLDGDTVESKNLERQNFSPETVGMNKAEALHAMYNSAHTQPKAEYLGADNITKYILDNDIVLIGADNMHVRRLIESHVKTLNDAVVINGGNEAISGSVQLYIRQGGKDMTPTLSHLHPEFTHKDADRSKLSCAEIAKLPGGEQTVLANATSAVMMLAALYRYHRGIWQESDPERTNWTEFQFDHKTGEYYGWDVRTTKGWQA